MILSQSFRARSLSALAIMLAAGAAHAQEIIVPTEMPLTLALFTAQPGTTITLLPSGSPYQTVPGYAFSGKHLIIRGSTGNPADVVIDGAGVDRSLSISNAAASGMTEIRGITITGGRGPNTSGASGAGLHLNNVKITIENCIIRGNMMTAALNNGAGLYGTASTLIVRNTTFENNSFTGTEGEGAAVYLNAGSAIFEDCRFINNRATTVLTGAASRGGAVYVDNGPFTFVRCDFVGNRAHHGGAAILGAGAIGTFEACLVQENQASFGGGIMTLSSTGLTTIRNSILSGNTAQANDSALRLDSATKVINTTIVGNSANNFAIGSAASDRRVVTVDNCIIWDNEPQSSLAPIISATNAPIIRRSLVQTAYSPNNGSGNNTVADPMFVGAATGDFRLRADSPAIDAGDTGLYFGPLADFAGEARAVAISVSPTGTALNGPVIDIGAFEFALASCYANCDNSTTPPVLNVDDFTCFINQFAQGCP